MVTDVCVLLGPLRLSFSITNSPPESSISNGPMWFKESRVPCLTFFVDAQIGTKKDALCPLANLNLLQTDCVCAKC